MLNEKFLRNFHIALPPVHVYVETFRAYDEELEAQSLRQSNRVIGLVCLAVCIGTFLVAAYCLGTPPDLQ